MSSLTKQSRTDNNATIKKLEELIKPLTQHLNLKEFNGLNKNGKIMYGKSNREELQEEYDNKLENLNKRIKYNYIRTRSSVPLKSELLRNEEIFTIILELFKKQQQQFFELEIENKKIKQENGELKQYNEEIQKTNDELNKTIYSMHLGVHDSNKTYFDSDYFSNY